MRTYCISIAKTPRIDEVTVAASQARAIDLITTDLTLSMEHETALHKVIGPVLDIAGDRKTLLFAASVADAERMAEIVNRQRPGSAVIVSEGPVDDQPEHQCYIHVAQIVSLMIDQPE